MTFPATHPALARAIASRGYTEATAVQQAVLDASASNRDLLVSAQTGSGKTVAFGLAMATSVLGDAETFDAAGAPRALIIAPTRELAMQVQRELAWLYAETGARVITCVGGMDVRAEARQLYAGAHIVVGTPGRLRDHLERNRLDLSALKAIVLDEADEMLDLGFREDLEYILDKTPEDRQSLLFSATMPKDIEAMARQYQRDAKRIETLRRNEQHADIAYSAIKVAPNDVEHAVVNVLRYHEMRAALVFCSTREAVRRLHARLAERGFSAVALSGELTQNERSTALQALRDGRARVLVATDVAARGLDLPDLALVIHADLPINRETLLHRSGRTGRAGRKGMCVLIVPYNRRRKAEALLGAARLNVTWAPAPTADEIRVRDNERFLASELFSEAASEDDLAQVRTLQAGRSADEIALALVRLNRTQLPAPEDLAEDTGPPPRRFDNERGNRAYPPRERHDREQSDYRSRAPRDAGGDGPSEPRSEQREPRASRPRHEDNRPMVWYRLNIGRERNADPRWLLPLICRAGNVTKADIGSIKIFDRDTRFQILAERADAFDASVKAVKPKEGNIARVGAHLEPTDTPKRDDAASDGATRSTEKAKPFHAKKPWHGKSEKTGPSEKPHKAPFDHKSHGKAKAKPHRKGSHQPFSPKATHDGGANSGDTSRAGAGQKHTHPSKKKFRGP
jgi:ATP-dependent RNA helicase DeaD